MSAPPEPALKGVGKELPSAADSVPFETSVIERWRPLWWLPCQLALQIPVAKFTVGELLRLRPGSLVSTGWSRSTEIPLYARGQRIGAGEFEAVGEHVGARITELV